MTTLIIIKQSKTWAFVGDEIRLTGTPTNGGNRVRFRVTAVPYGSKVELYNAAKQNWLTAGKVTVDVAGLYAIEAQEEEVLPNPPHYDNDPGVPGHAVGEEIITVLALDPYTLAVGEDLKRHIGYGQDTALLTVKSHYALTGSFPFAQVGACILTDAAGPKFGPSISELNTDAAKLAAQDVAYTVPQLREIGGGDYIEDAIAHGTQALLRPSLPAAVLCRYDPVTELGWLALAFAAHVQCWGMTIHGAPDTNPLDQLTALPVTSLAEANTALLDLRACFEWHMSAASCPPGMAEPAIHGGKDTVNSDLVKPAVLPDPGPASLSGNIAFYNALCAAYLAHCFAGYDNPTGMTTPDPTFILHGSRILAGFTYNSGVSDELNISVNVGPVQGAVLRLNPATATLADLERASILIRTAYTAHIGTDAVHGPYPPPPPPWPLYHNLGEFAASFTSIAERPLDSSSYIAAVNALSTALNCHVLNKSPVDGSAALYHLATDPANRTDKLPGASDRAQAIALHELIQIRFERHILTAGDVHQWNDNLGFWLRPWTGISKLNADYCRSLERYDAPTIPTENPGTINLIRWGGFGR